MDPPSQHAMKLRQTIEPAPDVDTKEEHPESATPTNTEIAQPTQRTPAAPRDWTGDDAEDWINSVVRIIREDIHLLTIRVDRMQTELHLEDTH